ncbi:MAG: hypothetical protein OS112_03560 [Methanoregula sp.]|nr:MAG: hypothetical protein OS112_03560 [Methanoregula sp.]
MSYAELKHPAPPPPLLPGQSAGTYPVGFFGLNFNVDNANTLELDLGAAQTAGAEVTPHPDRVEVYQHGSPSVLITFYGTNFEFKNGKIVGKVTRADFITSPLIGKIDAGELTGTVRVDLIGLTGKGSLTKTIDANVSSTISDLFKAEAERENLGYNSAAFMMNITKVNLEQTGAANLTFTVPSGWVISNGGIESVRIARISEKDHTTQVLDTRYLGTTPQDAMKFTAYSPDGTSIFSIITTKAVMAKGGKPSEGPLMTDIGMFIWLSQMGITNLHLVAVGAILLAGILFVGWSRRRVQK